MEGVALKQAKRDINIEEATKQARELGVSEFVIQWAINNLDLLEKLSDDNFEIKSSIQFEESDEKKNI